LHASVRRCCSQNRNHINAAASHLGRAGNVCRVISNVADGIVAKAFCLLNDPQKRFAAGTFQERTVAPQFATEDFPQLRQKRLQEIARNDRFTAKQHGWLAAMVALGKRPQLRDQKIAMEHLALFETLEVQSFGSPSKEQAQEKEERYNPNLNHQVDMLAHAQYPDDQSPPKGWTITAVP
jgi:hypothetical protein